jgi:hypothetical protein
MVGGRWDEEKEKIKKHNNRLKKRGGEGEADVGDKWL